MLAVGGTSCISLVSVAAADENSLTPLHRLLPTETASRGFGGSPVGGGDKSSRFAFSAFPCGGGITTARALAAAPAIILADEPTGNLDSKTSQDVLSLLKVTSQKFAQTIVMITHNEEIAQMADRIIRIEDGRIVSQN